VAVVLALASLGLNRALPEGLAMTGEITLRGRVLAVGGVKEKVLAAARAGATRLILPERNRTDLREVPADVRRKLKFVFVSTVDAALRAAGLRLSSRSRA
jgi:ATP-dependent Lon protease